MLGLPFDKLKAPSTAEGLRVDPERRFFTPPSKAGLGATEWVNCSLFTPLEIMPRCSLRARLRPGRAHAPEGGPLGRRLQRG